MGRTVEYVIDPTGPGLTEKQVWTNENILGQPGRHKMLVGGSRCVAGGSILDGHSDTIKELSRIGSPVPVFTSHGIEWADPPFRKGRTKLLRIDLDSGQSIEVTPDHRLWDGFRWRQAWSFSCGDRVACSSSPIPQGSIWEHVLSRSRGDGRRWTHRAEGFEGRCFEYCRRYGQQLLQVGADGRVFHAFARDAQGRSRIALDEACLVLPWLESDNQTVHEAAHASARSHSDLSWCHPSTLDAFPSTDPDAAFSVLACAPLYESFLGSHPECQPSLSLSFRQRSIPELEEDDLQSFLYDDPSSDIPLAGGYRLANVSAVTETAEQDYFTLHVPGTQQYFANGILHHNSGKTFLLVRAKCVRAMYTRGSRQVILRQRLAHVVESIWLDTLPKVLAQCFPQIPIKRREALKFIEFPTGSELWIGGLDDRERTEKILGKEFFGITFNECSQIAYASVITALTRLAQKAECLYCSGTGILRGQQCWVCRGVGAIENRAYYDLNPVGTGHWTYKLFVEHRRPESPTEAIPDPENYSYAYLNPNDNKANVDPLYISSLRNLPERQRRRFFEGLYVAELDGALWSLELIERSRITLPEGPEKLQERERIIGELRSKCTRIVVAIDPSGASGPDDITANEIGLTVCGIDRDYIGYVFEDATGLYSPKQWATVAIHLYHKWGADLIVAEQNYGGAMVQAVIENVDARVPVKLVTASRGKAVRAEPISVLYEKDLIRHVGRFPGLEDELINFTTTGYQGHGSPNRADACIWSFSELYEGIAASYVYRHLMTDELLYDAGNRPLGLELRGGRVEHWVAIRRGAAVPFVALEFIDDGNTIWLDSELYWDAQRAGEVKSDSQLIDMLCDGDAERGRKVFTMDSRNWPGIIVHPEDQTLKTELLSRGMFVVDVDDPKNLQVRQISTLLESRKLRIHKRCPNVWRDLSRYIWDEKRAESGQEQPAKTNTGGCEAIAYYVGSRIGEWRLSSLATAK